MSGDKLSSPYISLPQGTSQKISGNLGSWKGALQQRFKAPNCVCAWCSLKEKWFFGTQHYPWNEVFPWSVTTTFLKSVPNTFS